MNKEKQLFEKIKERIKLSKEIDTLLQELSAIHVPYQPGEETTARGYTYRGKKAIILRTYLSQHRYDDEKIDFTAEAEVYGKKGQKLSKVWWHSHDDPRLKEALETVLKAALNQ